MKTFILFALISITMNFAGFSQSLATTGKVDYQKGDKPAAIIELPYSPDIVEGALKENLGKTGVKEERIKGMLVFRGARLSPADGEVADLYFKIDKKSRKDDNNSVVYLIIGRPNENVALRNSDDSYRIEDAKTFLNNLMPLADAYNLEVNISRQEEEIKKIEKKLNSVIDDQKSLDRKINDLQERLAQNKREQEALNAEIVKQRSVRDALVARRVITAK